RSLLFSFVSLLLFCFPFHFSCISRSSLLLLFFFNAPSPTEIYTLSLHDALPILCSAHPVRDRARRDDSLVHGESVMVGAVETRPPRDREVTVDGALAADIRTVPADSGWYRPARERTGRVRRRGRRDAGPRLGGTRHHPSGRGAAGRGRAGTVCTPVGSVPPRGERRGLHGRRCRGNRREHRVRA